MDNGWIKLHNKFLRWEWSDDPNMVSLWIHFLLSANWQDKNWHGITVKRGQLVCGLQALRKQTGISIQSLRTCIQRLEDTQEITRKSTNKYSVITVLKWEKYQANNKNQHTNQQSINNQSTTPKEYKNIRHKDIIYNKELLKIKNQLKDKLTLKR